MGRISSLITVVVFVASVSGCSGPEWYRAAGDIPGIAATDYAFYNFCGTSSQLYPASPPQIESSAIEALGDLGFHILEPPVHLPSGESTIRAKTPDERPAKITISPQNSLTNVCCEIGPIHAGDQELSRDFFRRISLNFGTALRAHTPIEPTLAKRINVSQSTPEMGTTATFELKGEGLRPDEKRDKATAESAVPEQDAAPNLPAALQGLGLMPAPGPGGQANPKFQYVPFPIPTNDQDAP